LFWGRFLILRRGPFEEIASKSAEERKLRGRGIRNPDTGKRQAIESMDYQGDKACRILVVMTLEGRAGGKEKARVLYF